MTDDNINTLINDILFFKIWRNIVIKRNIFKFLLVKREKRNLFFKNTQRLYESFKRGELEGVDHVSFTGNVVFVHPYGIPASITSINLGDLFNGPVLLHHLPPTVTKLEFGQRYNHPFAIDNNTRIFATELPDTIKSIILGKGFNQDIKPGALPPSLTSLEFSKYLKELQIGSIPNGLKTLIFSRDMCELKPGVIPDSVTKIAFLYYVGFTGPIKSLPKSLTDLNIQSNLMQSYSLNRNIIPQSVTKLDLQISNTQALPDEIKLEELIPRNVKSLRFGFEFNENISGAIPTSCTALSLGYRFSKPLLPGDLPNSITDLKLTGNFFNQKFGNGDNGTVKLPPSLTSLELGNVYSELFDEEECFPSTLTSLKYYPFPGQSLVKFSSIVNLIFNDQFNGELNSEYFSPNCTTLNLGVFHSSPIKPNVLPNNLKLIKFGYEFDQKLIENAFPPSVTSISFGDRFNNKLKLNQLPPNLLHLEFGHYYVKSFGDVLLSLTSLESISVGRKFQHSIDKMKLPPSLISFIYR